MFGWQNFAFVLSATINFKRQPLTISHLGHPNTSSAKLTVSIVYIAHDSILFEFIHVRNRTFFHFGHNLLKV